MNSIKKVLLTLLVINLLSGCKDSEEEIIPTTSTIYYNGKIITMDTAAPTYAEALVEQDGKIAFVGSLEDAEKYFKNSIKKDLEGHTLLPGFIDPHSHFGMVSNTMGQVDLNPQPVGKVNSIAELLNALEDYKKDNIIKDGEWIFGWGYDESQLVEKRHPTKTELDQISTTNPIYIQHTSGHMGVVNSLALTMMKVTEKTLDPMGGTIGREENSTVPNGLVQETAMYPFVGNMLEILKTKQAEFFYQTQNYYAENGITTAHDGKVDRNTIEFYQGLANDGKLEIDLVVLAGYSELEANLADTSIQFKTYKNGFKVQGTKIVADGSPQGKTAFFTQPFLTPVPSCVHDCRGLPSLTQDELNSLFKLAYEKDNQLFIHCKGDATIDMVLGAHEFAATSLNQPINKDRRTIAIHSQFVRIDQLERYKAYHIEPSFFTNHAYFWGDVHVENLGQERAFFLSPIATADRLGLKYTNHSDATVTPINPLFTVWSAVTRKSRSGQVIGEKERATPYQALLAITQYAAYQLFDESIKGSLKAGKLADFVILDKNPLTAGHKELKKIKVIETIKNGKTVYLREKNTDLLNKKWRLITLNGQPIEQAANQEEAIFITFQSDSTFFGNTGCNSFNGSYHLVAGNKIKLDDNLAITTMVCAKNEQIEYSFLKTLKLIENYTANYGMLRLTIGESEPLAILETDY